MKTLKYFTITMILMAIAFIMFGCGRHTYGKCDARDRSIGNGASTKAVLKHYKN